MSDTAYFWQHVPHQHRGPHQHMGADDHIYSPKLHNGTFKSQGIATFLGAPYCPPDRNAIRAMGAKVCFIGVPWDQGQVVRAGTSQGAAGIREASTQYFPYMFEYDVDLLTFFRVVDCGDIPIVPGNNEKSHEYIYHYLTECLHGGAKVVLCGGDHSVPIPGARALSEFHKQGRIGYLHVDCHLDAAPDWAGNAFTNCSGPSRALDLPNCNAKNLVHMGSRNGLNPKDWHDFFVDNEVRLIPMQELVARGVVECTKEIFTRAWDGTDGVYFSWDTNSIQLKLHAGDDGAGMLRAEGPRDHPACAHRRHVRRRHHGGVGALSEIRREPHQHQDRGADDYALPRQQGEDPARPRSATIKIKGKSETP